MNVAVRGFRKTEHDPPEIIAARAEYDRLFKVHADLAQKAPILKKTLMLYEKRVRPCTPADIERARKGLSELGPRVEEAEHAFNSCAISRLIKGELTKEQIISGEIPPYILPVPKEDIFGPYPKEWILDNCKRWERGAKMRYYFKNACHMLEKANISRI